VIRDKLQAGTTIVTSWLFIGTEIKFIAKFEFMSTYQTHSSYIAESPCSAEFTPKLSFVNELTRQSPGSVAIQPFQNCILQLANVP
jgi:hypothetical protein